MNKDYLEKGIKELGPWFHLIQFPYNLVTKTESMSGEAADHPVPTWQQVRICIPEDLSGKTVLDIGCNAGFYSQQARLCNAEFVLGVDSRSSHIRQARFAARVNEIDRIRFERMSLYDLTPTIPGVFDVVLALGLVYHLKHLIFGLERLYQVTKGLLVIETQVAPNNVDSQELSLGPGSEILYPLFYVENTPTELEASGNWFIPTSETIQAMLRDVGFSEVKVVSEFNGRAVLLARKTHFPDSLSPRWLDASIEVSTHLDIVCPSEEISLELTVENKGIAKWLSEGIGHQRKGAVCLCAQLTSESDELFVEGLPWVELGKDVKQSETVEVVLTFKAPAQPGTYNLEIDMVSNQVSYFQDLGSAQVTIPLVVKS